MYPSEEDKKKLWKMMWKTAARSAGDVYVLQNGDLPAVKIGWAKDVQARIKELQIGNPHQLRLIMTLAGTLRTEGKMHRAFLDWQIRGEWFLLTPESLQMLEWFRQFPLTKRYSEVQIRHSPLQTSVSLREIVA